MALNISQNIKNIRNKYVTDAEQIKGGYGVVATVADLANLPSATIVEGSLYYCQADDKLYKYNGSAWVEFSVGGQEYTAGSGLLLNNHQFSVDTSTIATQANLTAGLANKQDTLVSGQNIKTINNNSIVGSGNLNIAPGTPMVFSDEEVEGGTSLRSITIDDEAWNIAAGGSTYTAGSNIQISDQNVISATDTVYTAGTGLNLVANQFGVDTDTIATKTYVDGKVTSLYKYKGSCVYADLPTSGQVTGDVWNVTDKHGSVPAGTNYAWDGSAWDPLGGSVDLSAYRTAANQDIIDATFATNTALQQGLATKITTGAISASTSEVAGASEAKSITIEGTSYNVGGSAAATWGSITGSLADQTDLSTALAGKQDSLPTVVNNKFLHTNATTGVLEWSDASGGVAWGSITGNLTSQTDLQGALDAKLSLTGGTITGDVIIDKGSANGGKVRLGAGTYIEGFYGGLYVSGPLHDEIFAVEDAAGTNHPLVIAKADINPYTNNTYDIGHFDKKWRDLYLSRNLSDGTNSITVAGIVAKQDALPTVTNDRYLHTNSETGALEWSTVAAVAPSNMVTTDTSQRITGEKRFDNNLFIDYDKAIFTDKLYSNWGDLGLSIGDDEEVTESYFMIRKSKEVDDDETHFYTNVTLSDDAPTVEANANVVTLPYISGRLIVDSELATKQNASTAYNKSNLVYSATEPATPTTGMIWLEPVE